MGDCFLIYDSLSSGVSANVFTKEGERVAFAFKPFKVSVDGKKAWQSADELWWGGAVQVTREVLKKIDASRIMGISFTAQGCVCLCVDGEGNALHDAITCQDGRAAGFGFHDTISEKMTADEYYSITGMQNNAGSSIRKFMWVSQFLPDVYKKTFRMLQCKDYMALKLTGKFFTDYTDANITGALDLNTMEWSETVLAAAGIDRQKMPDIVGSDTIIGEVTSKAAFETGLAEGTPVLMGVGDVSGSALGAGLTQMGQVYMNLSSSVWIAQCRNAVMPDRSPFITNSIHAIPGSLLCFAPSSETGLVFKWLKNEIFRYDTNRMRGIEHGINVYPYTNMEEQALRSVPGANGAMFYPYISGDGGCGGPGSRGAFLGLNWTNTREDMIRAALEGVCFELKNKLDFFRKDYAVDEITIAGTASHETLFLQIMADVFDMKVKNTTLRGTTDAVGAAVVIGNALGVYDGYGEARRFWKVEEEFEPDVQTRGKYRELFDVYMENRVSLGLVNKGLSGAETAK